MKRPTWVTAVGVLAIIFGCFGILGAGQAIIMPYIFQFQSQIMESIEDEMRSDPNTPEELVDAIMEMMNLPGWFVAWSVLVGIVGMLLNGLYVFGGIALLTVRRYAPKLMIWILSFSIALAMIQAIAAGFASTFLGLMMLMGAMFSIVIDFVLLLVIIFNDKRVFTTSQDPTPEPAVQ